jgi:hypothetical protein
MVSKDSSEAKMAVPSFVCPVTTLLIGVNIGLFSINGFDKQLFYST